MILAALPAVAGAQQIAVPSGQPVTPLDVITDRPGDEGPTWRFRFLAPEIARDGGTVAVDVALQDIDALCAGFVIDRLAGAAGAPGRVVISLSDRPVEFGVATPEATQIFEAYRVENGACIWEGF